MTLFASPPPVMAGLVPAIHAFPLPAVFAWMPGSGRGMTSGMAGGAA